MGPLKRILLVDDSPRDTELVLEALRASRLSNEVLALGDGAEALDFLYRRGEFAERGHGLPVVILLDLKMPRVDGIEVLRQVKGDPDLRAIPIVIMTSSREEQDIVKTYELGCNAYVVKPLRFDEFVAAIAQLGVFWAVYNEPPPGTVGRSHGAGS